MAHYTKQIKEYEEKVLEIKRVSKKTKGGNQISFTALLVLGNRQGKIGVGLGKSKTVSEAIQKGIARAKDEMVEIHIEGDTIPHAIEKKFKGAVVLLKPAPKGSGIIAGGSIRDVLELVGVKDISSKMLGSNNKITNVYCTIRALRGLRTSDAE